MGIRTWSSGPLTVATATTWSGSGSSGVTYKSDNSEAYSNMTINGTIEKIVLNFTSSDSNAILTIASQDTPSESFAVITDWSNDITLYPEIEATDNTNASLAASNKTNVFTKYVSDGSVKITCSGATANDTVAIKIYYRV